MANRRKAGRLTPMPSVTLSLGKYVVRKRRADGTFNVLFEVPERLRPSDWSPTIPLPRTGKRTGDLTSADEVRRIQDDAADLFKQLHAARAGAPVGISKPGTLPALIDLWKDDDSWTEMEERSRRTYEKAFRPIIAWSETNKHPQASTIDAIALKGFLAIYDAQKATKDRPAIPARPSMKSLVRSTLNQIFSVAVEAGALAKNPVEDLRMVRKRGAKRKRALTIWTAAIVDTYCAEALAMGWPGGAILVRAMWETSADSSDVMSWTKRGHFKDGSPACVEYDRGKTDVPTRTPISSKLAADIRSAPSFNFVVGRNGRPYDGPKDDARRDNDLTALRNRVIKNGGPRMIYDHIRHSAMTDAIDHGASYDDMPGLSAHTDDTMARRIYVQKTEVQATRIQQARGLIP